MENEFMDFMLVHDNSDSILGKSPEELMQLSEELDEDDL